MPFAIEAEHAVAATHATTATRASDADHATEADEAAHAATADQATNAQSATNAVNATNPTNAINATNATNATNAVNATNASNATGALDTRITSLESSRLRAPTGSVKTITHDQTSMDGRPLRLQAGTATGATNANGDLSIAFPNAFSGGVVTVLVTSGDLTGCDTVVIHGYTNSGFSVRSTPGHLCRFNYVAVGW